ncbi:hypothetical protein EJB05_28358, partial [Eragrostis curvula]
YRSMDEMKSANVSMEPEAEAKPGFSVSRFVKVFMQGELVGRKINLATHNSYASLSFTLKRLGNNFSMPSCELNGIVHKEEDGALDDNNFVIFYDNGSGDRFFFGEVPWEIFIISVRRIYIVRIQENVTENGEEEEGESPDVPLDGDDAPANDDGAVDDGDAVATTASADDEDAARAGSADDDDAAAAASADDDGSAED